MAGKTTSTVGGKKIAGGKGGKGAGGGEGEGRMYKSRSEMAGLVVSLLKTFFGRDEEEEEMEMGGENEREKELTLCFLSFVLG